MLNSQQQANILVKIQSSNATQQEKQAEIEELLSLTKLNDKEKEAIAQKLQLISAKKGNAEATKQETDAITQSLGGTKGISQGMAVGAAVVTGIFTAINSFDAAKQAKDSGEALGSGIQNGITSILTGAMTGFMVGGGPFGALIGAVGGALTSSLSSIIGYNSSEIERAISKANELTEAYRQLSETTKSNLSTLESLQDEFNRLSKGVSDYGENISLSAEEYRRYQEIVEQIIGISPSLRDGYDKEGKSIANKNGLIEESIRLLREERKERLLALTSGEDAEKVADGIIKAYEKVKLSTGGRSLDDALQFSGYQEGEKNPYGYYINLGKYIEDIIGVEYKGASDSELSQYIEENAELIDKNIKNIEKSLLEGRNGIRVQGQSWADAFVGYISNITTATKASQKAFDEFDAQLERYAQSADGYEQLTTSQQVFISKYIEGLDTFGKSKDELINIGKEVRDFVDLLNQDESDKSLIDSLFNPEHNKKSAAQQQSDLINIINNLSEETRKQFEEQFGTDPIEILTRLGFVLDVESLKSSIGESQSELKGLEDQIVNEFSESEIKLIINADAEINFTEFGTSIDKIRENFNTWQEELQSVSLSKTVEDSYKGLSDKIVLINKAISEQTVTGKILRETWDELGGATGEYKDVLSIVNGQYTITVDSAEKYKDELIATAIEAMRMAGATEEMIDGLRRLAQNIGSVVADIEGLSKSMQTAIKNADELSKVLSNISSLGEIDSESLKTIIAIFPEAIAYANDFAAMQEFVSQKIIEQENIAIASYGQIVLTNNNAINAIINKSSTLPDAIATYYGIDVNNFAKMSAEKYKLEATTVAKLSELWAKYATKGLSAIQGQLAFLNNQLVIGSTMGVSDPKLAQDIKDLQLLADLYTELEKDYSNIDLDFSSGGSGGGGSSSKSKEVEEYRVKIDELYEARKRLEEIQDSRKGLDIALNLTDNYKEQISLMEQIIDKYKQEQSVLHDINNLTDNLIQSNVEQLTSVGFDISYDPETNALLIRNFEYINELVGKTQEETNELRKSYEKLIAETEKLNNENREGSMVWKELQKQIRDTNLKIYEASLLVHENYIANRNKLNSWAADTEIAAIKRVQDYIQDSYNKGLIDHDRYISDMLEQTSRLYDAQLNKQKAYVDGVLRVAQREKEALQNQLDYYKQLQDNYKTANSTVVDLIDKKIKALQDENNELDKQLKKQEALEALERAKSQKVRVFKEGQGFVYDENTEEVAKAQQALDDLNRQNALDDEIARWQAYREEWTNAIDDYQRKIDEMTTASILGANYEQDILNMRRDNIAAFAANYKTYSDQLNESVEGSVASQINQLNYLIKMWGNAIDDITYNLDQYEGALDFVKDFEASNYTERLTMLSSFVSDSIKELDRLRGAQNSLMGVASGSSGSTGNTNNTSAFGKGYNTDWDYAQLILDSTSWSEVETWAEKRDQKIVGENIAGVPTTEEVVQQWIAEQTKKGKRFANGGPIDYTGPAWVDGTKQKPELALNNTDVAKVYNVIHTSSDLGEELKEGAGEIKQASNQLFRFLGEGEHLKSLGISPDAFNSHVLQGYGLISPVIEHFKNMSNPNLPASNNISHSSQPVQIVFEGDMSFPNVNNAEQFANEIYMKFENRFSQQTIKL